MTDTTTVVREAWAAALGRDDFGPDESFFDLGGHSLLGARVMASVSKQVGARLPLKLLFANRTVASLTAAIDAQLGSGASGAVAQ